MTQSTYRALVVDDEPMVRQLTMRALAREGFACEPAADGQEALQLVQQARYALVVTDLRMSGMNGHALATRLLALPHRPVVAVLTGVTEPKLADEARKLYREAKELHLIFASMFRK